MEIAKNLLTVPEVAARLKVGPEAVRRWLRDGKLRGVMLGGTKTGWRVSEDELARFIASATPAEKTGE